MRKRQAVPQRSRGNQPVALGRFSLRKSERPGTPSATAPELRETALAANGFTSVEATADSAEKWRIQQRLLDAKVRLHRRLIDEINLSAVDKVPEKELRAQVHGMVAQYVAAERIALNAQELEGFVNDILNEMTGLGPIEPLLQDPTITDILINTHKQIYVERSGQLEPSPARFKDEAHLLRIINK